MAEMDQERRQRLESLLSDEKRKLWTELRAELMGGSGDELHSQYDIPQDPGERSLLDLLEDTKLGVADLHKQRLIKLDDALRRLEQGKYGTCADCSVEIPEERLRVEPYSVRCVNCQEKREAPSRPERVTL